MNYTIRTVTQMTGLSDHTIRAWERRYGVLKPARTETNRRLYDDDDVERLRLLNQGVSQGHTIGQIARLSADELRKLVATDERTARPSARPAIGEASPQLQICLSAIDAMDVDALEQALARAGAESGVADVVERLIVPLVESIGARWADGATSIAQEHMATAVIRTFLERQRSTLRAMPNAPRLIVTTPTHQYHEIGALIVAVVAALHGWSVTYLGPNLPAKEIALASRQCGADAIGLSLVFPIDDGTIGGELRALRDHVGAALSILVGGRAASHYRALIEEIDGEIVPDLPSLRSTLDRIARPAPMHYSR